MTEEALVFRVRGCLHGREEDPSSRNIVEGETNFRSIYIKNFGKGGCWKSNKTAYL